MSWCDNARVSPRVSGGSSSRRRILFVVPPGYGHLFPIVPLAWAFRAAGHDVRIATGGIAINAAVRAGLAVVDVTAPGVDLAAIQRRHSDSFRQRFPPKAGDPVPPRESIFPEWCDAMADGVVAETRAFEPHLLIYTPEAMSALVASSCLQVPAVFFGLGLAHTPSLMQQRGAALDAACARHGVTALASPVAWIDLCPPSLKQTPADGLPMRYIQFNGGRTEPIGAVSGRPRIAVTLGTIVPFVCGLSPLKSIVDAAPGVDATFELAYSYTGTHELGPLPDNVHASPWIALDALLERAVAAIHHGGFGTTLACLAQGLPQLVLPQGTDQYYNAESMARIGAALVPEDLQVTRELLERLITDRSLRSAAERIASEIAAMPSPADVVPQLVTIIR